jgi:aminomethyltransferase
MAARLPDAVRVEPLPDRALLALQGPQAVRVVNGLGANMARVPFMAAVTTTIAGIPCHVSRSGYTGEDGVEISVAATQAGALWDTLLADHRVRPIGLGARDSLRLEAGLCLYGHDIDTTTSPIEAGLAWSIQRRRRDEGGFPGAARIRRELAEGPARKRVGIRAEGRQPAREGAEIWASGFGWSRRIGTLTSGGYGPSAGAPVAMGYVESAFATPGTAVRLLVRGKELPATVTSLPFVPHRYAR